MTVNAKVKGNAVVVGNTGISKKKFCSFAQAYARQVEKLRKAH